MQGITTADWSAAAKALAADLMLSALAAPGRDASLAYLDAARSVFEFLMPLDGLVAPASFPVVNDEWRRMMEERKERIGKAPGQD